MKSNKASLLLSSEDCIRQSDFPNEDWQQSPLIHLGWLWCHHYLRVIGVSKLRAGASPTWGLPDSDEHSGAVFKPATAHPPPPATAEVDGDAGVSQEERKATWPLRERVQNHRCPTTVLLECYDLDLLRNSFPGALFSSPSNTLLTR